MNRLFVAIVTIFFFCLVYTQDTVQPKWKFAKVGTDAQVLSLVADSSGNLYAVGKFYSNEFEFQGQSVQGIGTGETSNLFMFKINQAGRLIWLHSIRGTVENCSFQIIKLAINEKGETSLLFSGYGTSEILIGDKSVPLDETFDTKYLTKISKSGFILWTKTIITTDVGKPGNYISDIVLDEDGSVYATGSFSGDKLTINETEISGLGTEPLMFVSKCQENGNVEWLVKNDLDTTADDGTIYAKNLTFGPDNTLLISGYYDGYRNYKFGPDILQNSPSTDAFLACYSKDGEALWAKGFNGELPDYNETILTGLDGSICYVGFTRSDSMNVSGNTLGTSGNDFDLFLVLFDIDGNYLNSRTIELQMTTISQNEDLKIRFGTDNNLYLAAEFTSAEVFAGEIPVINSDAGFSDIVIAKILYPTLDLDWAIGGYGAGYDYLENVAISPEGNITFAGGIYKSITYNETGILENPDNGGIYIATIHNEGDVDYIFRKANDTDRQIYQNQVVTDHFGNIYLTGRFYGQNNQLDDITVDNDLNVGLFLAKYAKTTSLSGIVFDEEGNPVNAGMVKLIGHTYRQKSPVEDSVFIEPDGSYQFDFVPDGRFILQALPPETNFTFVPIYYPDAQYWEEAQQLLINSLAPNQNVNIYASLPLSGTGTGQINGSITKITEDDILKSTFNLYSKPKQKSRVKLASKTPKSTYYAVYYTETDEDGNFYFEGIPDGIYDLFVDEAGLPSEKYINIEIYNGQYYNNLDFFEDEESITTTGVAEPVAIINENDQEDYLYPNPSSGIVFLNNLQGNYKEITVFDMSGRKVFSNLLENNSNTIDLSELPIGSYTIKLMSAADIKVVKLIMK